MWQWLSVGSCIAAAVTICLCILGMMQCGAMALALLLAHHAIVSMFVLLIMLGAGITIQCCGQTALQWHHWHWHHWHCQHVVVLPSALCIGGWQCMSCHSIGIGILYCHAALTVALHIITGSKSKN